MFWGKSYQSACLLAGAGLALALSVPAQAGVVIKSSGPSAAQFPVGKKVDDKGRITLKDGDSVTVLTNGRTRVIKGAGTHRVAARGSSKRSAFDNLTRQRSGARARAGVARGPDSGMPAMRPGLWDVDVTYAGPMCVAPDIGLRLWRPDSGGAASYLVASPNTAEPMRVSFADTETTTDWDMSRMPVTGGARYVFSDPAGSAPVEITFMQIETLPQTPEALAEILIAKGCAGQLDLLGSAML